MNRIHRKLDRGRGACTPSASTHRSGLLARLRVRLHPTRLFIGCCLIGCSPSVSSSFVATHLRAALHFPDSLPMKTAVHMAQIYDAVAPCDLHALCERTHARVTVGFGDARERSQMRDARQRYVSWLTRSGFWGV